MRTVTHRVVELAAKELAAGELESAAQGHDGALGITACARQCAHAFEQEQRLKRRPSGRLVQRADFDREPAFVADGRRRRVKLAFDRGGDRSERHFANQRVGSADPFVGHLKHPGAPQEAERLGGIEIAPEHPVQDDVVRIVAPNRQGLERTPGVGRKVLDANGDDVG